MGGLSVAAAIIVGLLSSFIQSLGLTIQRKSHVQDSSLPVESQRRPHRRPLWLLGFGIYITSNIFSTIFQLDALPIVILAPLGAVSLIYNALLARLILGDHFGPKTIGGTALVAGGAVMIAVFGVVPEEEHTLQEILRLWSRPAFLVFFSIVMAGVVITLIGAHISSFHISRQMRIQFPADDEEHTQPRSPPTTAPLSNYASLQHPPPIPFKPLPPTSASGTASPKPSLKSARRWSAPVAPISSSTTAGNTISVTADKHRHTVRFAPSIAESTTPEPKDHTKALTLTGLAFAAASGVLSGMSLVCAKAAVELLVITIDHIRTGRGENQFQHVQSWFLVAGLLTGGVLQLVYLNYSLTFASPALVCPLAFCFFNMSSIFDGLVFYDQFSRLRTHQIVLVSLGTALLLLGVWIVSALTPTGDGGVDVGTWVEEEDQIRLENALSEDETDPLFARRTEEPEDMEGLSPHATESYSNAPSNHTNPPWHDLRSPSITSLYNRSPISPHQPNSPSRLRRPRYGTLIPDLAPPGAPTGFAIGLGAASPGFVLRPDGAIGFGTVRKGRSRSEGNSGIQAIMQAAANESRAGSVPDLTIRVPERDPVGLGIAVPDSAVSEQNVQPQEVSTQYQQPNRGLWDRVWRREGKIRLEETTSNP